MTTTMRVAFVSALESLFAMANQNDQAMGQTVICGPDKEMLLARHEEYLMDENGVEMGGEFVVDWNGIKTLENRNGIITLDLVDGKTITIEACP